MKKTLLTTTIALLSLAGAASAQSFIQNAELSYTYSDSDDDYTGQYWHSSVEAGFGSIGGQFDYTSLGFDGDVDSTSYGLHVNYRFNDSIVAGAFYAVENWDGDDYGVIGLEGQFDWNQFSIEAAIGQYSSIDYSGYEFDFVSIDGSYDFGNGFSVLANLAQIDGSEEIGIVGVGARYERSGAFIETTFSQFSGDDEHQVVGVEVGFVFGGGTTFESRDWAGIFGLY